MKNLSRPLASVALTLWVGSLWAIGYIAAPSLFAALHDNRALAGMLAGKMFTVTAYVGLVCALYLLIFAFATEGGRAFKQSATWIILLMLGLTLIAHFGVQPIIEGLKVQGGTADVMRSATASRFAQWHGIASVLYLVQSVLGLILVWRRG